MKDMYGLIVSAVIFTYILIYFCIPELKQKRYKTFFIYISFLLTGFVLLTFSSFGLDAPSPIKMVEALIRKIFKLP